MIQYTIPATATPTSTPVATVTPTPVTPTTTEVSVTPSFTPTFTPTPTQVPSGPVTINYTYDPLYRLTAADYSTGDTYHYTYDAVGNRLNETTHLATTNYLYDDANRIQTVNGVPYVYDNNGNLKNDGVNNYDYDSANRLKAFTNASTTAIYAYNGLNDRLQETVNGSTTTFTMDLNTGLTQALSDGTTTYIYGNARIAQTQGSATEYFLGDALGSVRQMTSASGTITYASAYDPYGVTSQTYGASQTSYGYTNEYTSQGLIYLRARYYAPGSGRFITRDTWEGDVNSPMSYNAWLYGYANPITNIDPSGYSPCSNLPPEDRDECLAYMNDARSSITFYSRGREWSAADKSGIYDGVTATASAFVRLLNHMGYPKKSAGEAFRKIFGTVGFYASSIDTSWYCERYVYEEPKGVMCYPDSNNKITGPLVAHELGHVYNATFSNRFSGVQTPYNELSSLIASQQGFSYVDDSGVSHKLAEYRESELWRDPTVGQDSRYIFSSRRLVGEEFADMFANWVYGGFNGPAGLVRNTWMTNRLQADMSLIFGVLPNPSPLIDICGEYIR